MTPVEEGSKGMLKVNKKVGTFTGPRHGVLDNINIKLDAPTTALYVTLQMEEASSTRELIVSELIIIEGSVVPEAIIADTASKAGTNTFSTSKTFKADLEAKAPIMQKLKSTTEIN